MSARSSRPRMWFSARAVSTSLTGPAMGDLDGGRHPLAGERRGRRSDRRLARSSPRSSSRPGRPRRARPIVSATPPGSSANAFSRSADTGRSVAARDRGGVCERLVAGHRAVEPPERRRDAAAGRGQRLEAERGEQRGRADVPGVRHQQRIAGPVQLQEFLRLFRLSVGHGRSLTPLAVAVKSSAWLRDVISRPRDGRRRIVPAAGEPVPALGHSGRRARAAGRALPPVRRASLSVGSPHDHRPST